ncbi:MAG: penicillin-binding transpeptidase domain-containing protein [Luteolibacter sp.]
MVNRFSLSRFMLVSALAAAPLSLAQQASPSPDAPAAKLATDGSILTRKDARAITLKIPAPRGQIVDREGEPLAQTSIAYQVGLQFRQFENADRDFVLNWAKTRLADLGQLVKNPIPKTDEELYDHYKERRWLPLLVSGQISEKEAKAIEKKMGADLVLYPVYRRFYPNDGLAAHIVGYTGSVGKLPTGPINFNEPLWEESEGRAGLEKIFDRQLTGEPGMKRLLFDENGNKLLEEQVKRPKPGGTIVTTLNLKWQKLAENVLQNGCRRGAFVVIDVVTGEVLVMASRPTFDLNLFIPGIGEKEYGELRDDASQPLFGRAFQSAYPPASTFKPIVALAALNQGTITENTEIYCPASLQIGNAVFRNWSKTAEGSIDVRRALARSCNPWFYQVGIKAGPTSFLNLARRMGFGERTGLPLIGETAGLVPNDEWMLKNEKRRILDGDTANLSIGQGVLLSSPLQVAQGMAAIANGGVLPKLQLIRQSQDTKGRVVQVAVPSKKNWLGVDAKMVDVVRDGMNDVVSKGYGTGKAAGLSYTTLCGKTGTAQWGPKSKEQRLAWFAGFLPHDNPRFAFAVLYEGRPGETVSGGRMAAPMVRNFFEPLKDDIKEIIAPPKKALVVAVDEGAEESAPKARKADEEEMDAAPPEETPEDSREPESPTVLKAQPVEDMGQTSDVRPLNPDQDGPPARATPVNEDDDVMDENVEQP